MYNTSDKASIHVNDSMKNIILIGLMIYLAVALVGGYFLSFFGFFEGTELGRIVFTLFILSEIPILINYFYFVVSKLGLQIEKLSSVFGKYYTPSLLVHSGIYTFMIGLTFAHILSVGPQSIYCLLFTGIFALLWIIDYILWFFNWPVHPRVETNTIFLYWIQWIVLFGLLIGLPFHTRTSNLFWISVFPVMSFGSLFFVMIQEFRDRRTNTRKVGNPVT